MNMKVVCKVAYPIRERTHIFLDTHKAVLVVCCPNTKPQQQKYKMLNLYLSTLLLKYATLFIGWKLDAPSTDTKPTVSFGEEKRACNSKHNNREVCKMKVERGGWLGFTWFILFFTKETVQENDPAMVVGRCECLKYETLQQLSKCKGRKKNSTPDQHHEWRET